jgi:hypothetical protein
VGRLLSRLLRMVLERVCRGAIAPFPEGVFNKGMRMGHDLTCPWSTLVIICSATILEVPCYQFEVEKQQRYHSMQGHC